MNYLIDSHAWIEYFQGSKKGSVVKRYLEDERNQFLTVICCLAEIRGWSLKNQRNFEEYVKIVESNSTILPLNKEEWIQAAEEKHEQRKTQKDFGLIDATLLVKQKQLHAKIISGDKHFKHLKNVIFLE